MPSHWITQFLLKFIAASAFAFIVCAPPASAQTCRAPCKWVGKDPLCLCPDTMPKYSGPTKDGPMLKPEPAPTARAPIVNRIQGGGCLINGVMRKDIPANDCEEAKRTGCVRSLLTANQYINCLKAQEVAYKSGRRSCIIAGKNRNDLSELDCQEAKATGCVRRLLTPSQYTACLDAQPRR